MCRWMVVLSGMLVACQPKAIATLPSSDTGPSTPLVTAGSTTPTGTTLTSTGTTGSAGPLDARITGGPSVVELGDMVTIPAEVTSSDSAPIAVEWASDVSGVLQTGAPDSQGSTALVTNTLPLGWHHITLTATQGTSEDVAETDVGICAWPPVEDFATGASISGWTLFGNAAWDPGGWLEITGNIQASDGAIYKTDRKVNPGNIAIEFDIATGGGINTGADGFSVNVIDAYDETELASIVNSAANGGCLGYGTDGGYCGTRTINAFHIEFDTWYNGEIGVEDPTTDNHVAIALNGDPRALLWVAVPNLEDLVWRHVRVEINGSDVTVFMDGAQVIQGTLPGFAFDGGYIGVSGSTGYATNYHRFDNLQLYDVCTVPSTTSTTSP